MTSTTGEGDGASNSREPLLRPRDVAARLRIAEKTLGEWRSLGTGPKHLRLGRTIRYRASDVEAYLDECAGDGADKAEAELKPPTNGKKKPKRKKAGTSGTGAVETGENRSRRKKKGNKSGRRSRS